MQYIYGIHAVDSLLRQNPRSVQRLWAQQGREDNRIGALLELAQNQGVPVARETRRALDEMALPQPRVPWATELVPRGLPAFVAACVLAFMLIASLLSFLAFGAVDVRSAAIGTRPAAAARR